MTSLNCHGDGKRRSYSYRVLEVTAAVSTAKRTCSTARSVGIDPVHEPWLCFVTCSAMFKSNMRGEAGLARGKLGCTLAIFPVTFPARALDTGKIDPEGTRGAKKPYQKLPRDVALEVVTTPMPCCLPWTLARPGNSVFSKQPASTEGKAHWPS